MIADSRIDLRCFARTTRQIDGTDIQTGEGREDPLVEQGLEAVPGTIRLLSDIGHYGAGLVQEEVDAVRFFVTVPARTWAAPGRSGRSTCRHRRRVGHAHDPLGHLVRCAFERIIDRPDFELGLDGPR